MELQFAYKGERYGLDLDDEFSVTEARVIKQHTGMTVKGFLEGFQEGDVDSLVGVVVLGVRRGGGEIEWSDLDDFNLMDLMASMSAPDGTPLTELAERSEAPEMPAALNRASRRANDRPSGGKAATTKPSTRKTAAAR